MNIRSIGFVIATGIATFLIVGVAVTELAQPWIEFSLFVGIPAGLVAGVLAAALVALGLGEDAPVQERQIARSFGAFAVVFLAVLAIGGATDLGVWLSVIAGVIVGGLAAVGLYVRQPKPPRPETSA